MQQIIKYYKELHRYPELSRKEYCTSRQLEVWLKDMGLEVKRIGQTAVVGILKGGKEGKTVALRADIDALPIKEQTGLCYASQNDGVMHACGHDFHMAAVLGAAKLLAAQREDIKGTVQFIFQPDEEGDGYAAELSRHDIMKDTVAVFGAHVDPTLPHGSIGIRKGPFYATAGKFDITFSGSSAHGATPDAAADALATAALAVTKLIALRSEDTVVSVGTLHSGLLRNIIADHAELSGIIRVAGTEARDKTYADIAAIMTALEKQTGVHICPQFTNGYNGITNPTECTLFVREVAAQLYGEDAICDIDHLLPVTEDFGEYLDGREGCYYHFGVGTSEGLHSARFAPDPQLLPRAATLHAQVIKCYLDR